MVKRRLFWHSFSIMNLIAFLPLALLHLSAAAQTVVLFFLGWALIMFLVFHLDGTRAR